MVIIDTKAETTGLLEARKLGIPTICLIDTDGNPEMADIAIPGNDDSMRSIDVIVRELCLAVADGRTEREQSKALSGAGPDASGGSSGGDAGGDRGEARPRRTGRSQFKRDGSDAEQPAQA